eukprot:2432007-Amphidinium_carterae.1
MLTLGQPRHAGNGSPVCSTCRSTSTPAKDIKSAVSTMLQKERSALQMEGQSRHIPCKENDVTRFMVIRKFGASAVPCSIAL